MRIEREWSGVEWWGILTAGLLFISRRQAEEIKKNGRYFLEILDALW